MKHSNVSRKTFLFWGLVNTVNPVYFKCSVANLKISFFFSKKVL